MIFVEQRGAWKRGSQSYGMKLRDAALADFIWNVIAQTKSLHTAAVQGSLQNDLRAVVQKNGLCIYP